MANNTLRDEITEFTAGDTIDADALRFSDIYIGEGNSATDFTAATYTLAYTFRYETGSFTVDCTTNASDSDAFDLDVSDDLTYDLPPGDLYFVGRAEHTTSGARHDIDRGVLLVRMNPARETHSQRVLDAIRANIEGRASNDQRTIMIGDVQLSHMNPAQMLQWEKLYAQRVKHEFDRARKLAGIGTRMTVQTRFV